MTWPNFLSAELLAPVGTGIFAFVTGRVTKRDARISALEQEVEECRKRDGDVVVIKSCIRVLMGDAMRREPGNEAVRMCADLLNRRLGENAKEPDDFQDLLNQIDAVSAPVVVPAGVPLHRQVPRGGSDAL